MGQLQVQQAGYVEDTIGKSFVTQLIAVQSHKCQMSEVSEIVSELDEKKTSSYVDVYQKKKKGKNSNAVLHFPIPISVAIVCMHVFMATKSQCMSAHVVMPA